MCVLAVGGPAAQKTHHWGISLQRGVDLRWRGGRITLPGTPGQHRPSSGVATPHILPRWPTTNPHPSHPIALLHKYHCSLQDGGDRHCAITDLIFTVFFTFNSPSAFEHYALPTPHSETSGAPTLPRSPSMTVRGESIDHVCSEHTHNYAVLCFVSRTRYLQACGSPTTIGSVKINQMVKTSLGKGI